MLKVFFDTDNIGTITDMLDAEKHSFPDFAQSKSHSGRGRKNLSRF